MLVQSMLLNQIAKEILCGSVLQCVFGVAGEEVQRIKLLLTDLDNPPVSITYSALWGRKAIAKKVAPVECLSAMQH